MKRRIIVADSDKQSGRLIKNLISAAGYETVTVSNFSECFTMVSLNTPDIVLIDPDFPLQDGIKTIKKLRERGSFPIIAVSENGSERAVTEALDAGADDYIRKPFLSGELLSRIKAAMGNSRASSPYIRPMEHRNSAVFAGRRRTDGFTRSSRHLMMG